MIVLLSACGGSSSTDTKSSSSLDKIKPVIQLKGLSDLTIIAGSPYKDAGVTASDNIDGDITAKVIKTGEVNTLKVASYTLHYNVKDKSGNSADEVTRHISVVNKNYEKLGGYKVLRYPDAALASGDYVVYYPKDGITKDMPVVAFLEGGGLGTKIDDYRGVMKYLASQGYFVIGAESGGGYDTDYNGLRNIRAAIKVAQKHHHLTVSKLAVMGHSQGGGQSFYVMKKLQEDSFGSEASLVLSIDGWFSFDMTQADFRQLQGTIAFIQMNGLKGTGTDPRIDLTIWNLASQTEKHFLTLPQNNHGYIKGDIDTMLKDKKDVLYLVGSLLDDAFNKYQIGYESIPSKNKATYKAVFDVLKSKKAYKGGD